MAPNLHCRDRQTSGQPVDIVALKTEISQIAVVELVQFPGEAPALKAAGQGLTELAHHSADKGQRAGGFAVGEDLLVSSHDSDLSTSKCALQQT